QSQRLAFPDAMTIYRWHDIDISVSPIYRYPAMNPILIIGNLAEAVGGGHTRNAITRRIFETLQQHVPLRGLTLGWLDNDGHTALVNVLRVADDDVEERRETLAGSATELAIQKRRPLILTHNPESRYADARHAFDNGADTFIAVPLFEANAVSGYVHFELASDIPPDFLDRAFLATVGKVLLVAMRNAHLIERVATLSRRAHRENQQLRQQLEKLATPETLVGRSPAMRAVLERVDLVARHPTTVLLRGESGT